jgi:hypothetical protein
LSCKFITGKNQCEVWRNFELAVKIFLLLFVFFTHVIDKWFFVLNFSVRTNGQVEKEERLFTRVSLRRPSIVAAKKNSYSFLSLSHRTNIHNRFVLCRSGLENFSLFLSHTIYAPVCMCRGKFFWLFIHSQLSLRKLRIFVECTSAIISLLWSDRGKLRLFL